MKMRAFHSFTGLLPLLAAGAARAHDGHGLLAVHWHASDLWGLALVVGLVAAVWGVARATRDRGQRPAPRQERPHDPR